MSFIPAVRPAGQADEKAYWFVFQDNRLLVRLVDGGAHPPLGGELESLGLRPLRTQHLGALDGHPCYSAELDREAAAPEGMFFEQLRRLWGSLPEELFWIAGRAFQVMDWDRNHQFCGSCGARTERREEERVRACPRCGLASYPRISPAIIVAVTREDRILLARARRFPTAMYSVIAGFVEPGESLEQCVHREIDEEVGITVKNLRYFGSQSWPFPNSLMVAFTAEHAGGKISIDPSEIVDAGWFAAGQLPRIPERLSIARRLIDWYIDGARSRGSAPSPGEGRREQRP